jgi:magnesium chelatase family protein
MARINKHLQRVSLVTLLQEIQNRIEAGAIPADQQPALLQMCVDILEACGKRIERPLPGHDLSDVRGEIHVKRALEVAAAGGHHILLIGPPAAGKAMLARTLPSLLPATSAPVPFRAPSPDMSLEAFMGTPTLPGDLTLAHGGVLLIEDLDAFAGEHLSAPRQAVKTHGVMFSQGETRIVFPAHFLIVATIRPCPCGFSGDPVRACTCSADAIIQYHQRLDATVEACFAIQIEVPRVGSDLLSKHPEESSATVRSRVEHARTIQQRRYAELTHLSVNADLGLVDEIGRFCELEPAAEKLLSMAIRQLALVPPTTLEIQKVARTIADLAESNSIAAPHVAEAIQYRPHFGNGPSVP